MILGALKDAFEERLVDFMTLTDELFRFCSLALARSLMKAGILVESLFSWVTFDLLNSNFPDFINLVLWDSTSVLKPKGELWLAIMGFEKGFLLLELLRLLLEVDTSQLSFVSFGSMVDLMLLVSEQFTIDSVYSFFSFFVIFYFSSYFSCFACFSLLKFPKNKEAFSRNIGSSWPFWVFMSFSN